jgi:hypothetical protein
LAEATVVPVATTLKRPLPASASFTMVSAAGARVTITVWPVAMV